MSLPAIEPTPGERRHIIDRVAHIVADEFCAEVNLLTPEVVAALCKCDIRTLEGRGLTPVRIGPRMIRYRKADLDALIRSLMAGPTGGRKGDDFPQEQGGRVKSDLNADPRRSR